MLPDLASNWTTRPLGEVCDLIMGQAPKGNTYNNKGIGTPLIAGAADLGPTTPKPKKWTNAPTKIGKQGDIILCVRATIGNLNWADIEYCYGRGVAGIRVNCQFDPEFIWFWLTASKEHLLSLGRGATFKQISKADIANLPVPGFDIAEQRRIVARIKECMERVEEIEGLRAEVIEEAKGIYPSRCHDFFSRHDSESEWHKTTIGELSLSIQYGYTQSATKSPVGPKFLRITDIQNHSVDWESVPYCKADTKVIKKYQLKEGDILFARTGATTGKSFLIENTPPLAVFASYLIRLQIDKERVLPRLVYHFFQSPAYWDQVRRNMRGGAQPNINSKVLSSLSVTIPSSPDEQRIVVKQLDHAFKLSLGLSAVVSDQTKSIGSLRDSILRKAFAGEL